MIMMGETRVFYRTEDVNLTVTVWIIALGLISCKESSQGPRETDYGKRFTFGIM